MHSQLTLRSPTPDWLPSCSCRARQGSPRLALSPAGRTEHRLLWKPIWLKKVSQLYFQIKYIIRYLVEPLDEGDDQGIWRDFVADFFASLYGKNKLVYYRTRTDCGTFSTVRGEFFQNIFKICQVFESIPVCGEIIWRLISFCIRR